MSYAIDRPAGPVNPAHYRLGKVELIDLIEQLTFNVGNAVKYLVRAGKKGDLAEDLRKAIWYAARELHRVTGKPSKADELEMDLTVARQTLGYRDSEIAEYERTVATLREQLRESERGRSASNAVDAAARRLMASAVEAMRVEDQPADEARLLVDEKHLRRLAMAIADAGKVPA